jgi:AraC family ethanolamine operon transcriptional activator
MPEAVFIRQKFNDFDHLQSVAPKWSLDFKQLDSGRFFGELMIVDFNELQFGTTLLNRHFQQGGETPRGYRTIAIAADSQQSIVVRGQTVGKNDLMVFPESRDVDAISLPGFNVFIVSISNTLIENFISSHEPNSDRTLKMEAGLVSLKANTANQIRQQLSYLNSEMIAHPDVINNRAFRQILMKEIPEELLGHTMLHPSKQANTQFRIRDLALKKATDYIDGCKDDMPSVSELCLITGASQRTLEYAFHEKYGFGPKEFMIKHSLNIVNKALKRANPFTTKVQDLAHNYGFWHMGQFSADYKKLFGELPSETLRNG